VRTKRRKVNGDGDFSSAWRPRSSRLIRPLVEITHHVDVSWNQSWTGTDQKRVARFEGNRVYLSTPPSLDPITGTMSMRTMTWEKLGRARPATPASSRAVSQ